jgi:transaldolase/glucose-6-phosphate isomerase
LAPYEIPAVNTPGEAGQCAVAAARALGQSVWFDDLSRELLRSGRLASMVAEDGLCGVTSNPSIFERAIAGGGLYDTAIAELARIGVRDPVEVCERLMTEDVREAADVLLPLYYDTAGTDGYVSLEVSPAQAHDRDGMVAEAHRLACLVGRPNLMIKVPATAAGIEAIEELLADGINVNATLIFSVEVYKAVAEAHARGLGRALAKGIDLGKLASVASFFISRIDTRVDARLDEALAGTTGAERRERLHALLGKAAIANARLAYAHFQETLCTAAWQGLAAHGARPQRLLWASTGTKNPAYPKTYYVEALLGADTVDTMPEPTYLEFRLRGAPALRLGGHAAEAQRTIEALAAAGIAIDAVTAQLLEEGVRLFVEAQQRLLATIRLKLAQPSAIAARPEAGAGTAAA